MTARKVGVLATVVLVCSTVAGFGRGQVVSPAAVVTGRSTCGVAMVIDHDGLQPGSGTRTQALQRWAAGVKKTLALLEKGSSSSTLPFTHAEGVLELSSVQSLLAPVFAREAFADPDAPFRKVEVTDATGRVLAAVNFETAPKGGYLIGQLSVQRPPEDC